MRVGSAVAFATFAFVTLRSVSPGVETFFNAWFYDLILGAACVIARTRTVTVERHRGAWIAFTAAIVSWTFGELWWTFMDPTSYPSAADLGYIAFYPLTYVGIALLLRSRAKGISWTLWLDAVTASLAAATFGAAVIVEIVHDTTDGSLSTVATNLAYPLGDVLLLSAIVGVFALSDWRPERQWLVIGAAILTTLIADTTFLFQAAAGTYVEGEWIDVLWPLSMLLLANAAWVRDGGALQPVSGRPLLAVPALAALVGIGVLVWDHFHRLNLLAIALATAALLSVVVRLVGTFRENRRLLALSTHEAITDPLTGLGNRRLLISDLERALGDPAQSDPSLLVIFDLDGFKSYNDAFGHPAGDALLVLLGERLAAVAPKAGAAYRLGGDEFCLLAPAPFGAAETLIDASYEALREHGDGFDVTSSFGAVLLPADAADAREALRVADERLYAQKHSKHSRRDRPHEALMQTLREVEPGLHSRLEGVAQLALETGRRLGLTDPELDELSRAAQLHDIGKLAVPAEILRKPGPLDESEWEFIRQHTIVGERILRASPALRGVAAIVRSTHESWDGSGYPDGLSGDAIRLSARLSFVCDAFDAMTSPREYSRQLTPDEALVEIAQNAGTQFDPRVARIVASIVRAGLPSERAA
jgi:diguanylate cyclase (GGDEF)-like protein